MSGKEEEEEEKEKKKEFLLAGDDGFCGVFGGDSKVVMRKS